MDFPLCNMKGRHQFRRRFSLQPSFLKEESEDESRPHRTERVEHPVTSSSGNLANNAVRHKIVVMGAAKVGKSSLISQFLYGTFSTKYKRTIEEMHHGDFNVAGVRLTLDILDTSGAYEFPAMRALSMQSADAFILVYDITDAESFTEARALRDQIHETKGSTAVPIVVVGNKVDLAESGERQVEFHTTESVVTVDWENGFVEASAKDNVNVSQIFKELLVQAKVKYNLSPALRRRRRQSMPTGPQGPPGSAPSPSSSNAPHVPSPAQLAHLQQIRERHANSKRNSCVIS
ncbi:ras-related protein Rap-2b [Maniola hyperantus]|uniref:ras-related protein Rap-2b n=1 Tax=Aphantopus hyperantus TaxID=2795564 RepID=UPI0015685A9C|nr:ras-related protein Rap-2b [Maniola hyperantus]